MPYVAPAAPGSTSHAPDGGNAKYNLFLLVVAGLGGLLYGVDVGIIGGALPYLEATSGLNEGQLSIIVASVLLGSVIATLFAGLLADWMGRKPLMILSGLTFVLSIPVIALSHGYGPLFFGRLLQGVSGGFIGVVVPLYLAECLTAAKRGKGTGVFQWLLTLGIVSAALIAFYYSNRLEAFAKTASAAGIFAFKNEAWRRIFWVCLPPGVLFTAGSFFVEESPRWLFLRGKKDRAYSALLRSRTPEQAAIELEEMEQIALASKEKLSVGQGIKDSLLRKKYIFPFLLAVIILAFNQTTGINSIIGYNTGMLLQSGLSDFHAHLGYVIFTIMNFLMTMVGMNLVDRKGRKFLFLLGTSGIILSLAFVGILFLKTEKLTVDRRDLIQPMVTTGQTLSLPFSADEAKKLLAGTPGDAIRSDRASMTVIYSFGDFTAASGVVRSDDPGAVPIQITRESAVPANEVQAFFQNPFANLEQARRAPLKIERALIGSVPDEGHGWLVALGLYLFISFYALGPGVCVWLALSELMPTRIRSNGMSFALLANQAVSTTLAAIFLPVVSKHGYSFMFFLFTGCTVVYMLTVAFFLPETKGKTLEEIEAHFERP